MPNERVENPSFVRDEVSKPSSNTADLLLDVWGPRETGTPSKQQHSESQAATYSQEHQMIPSVHMDAGMGGAYCEPSSREVQAPQEKTQSQEQVQAQGSQQQQQKPKEAPGAGGPSDTKDNGISPECIDWSKVPPLYLSY